MVFLTFMQHLILISIECSVKLISLLFQLCFITFNRFLLYQLQPAVQMKPQLFTPNPSRLFHIIKTKIQRPKSSCSSNSNHHGNQTNDDLVEDVIDDSLNEDIVRFVSDNIDTQLLRKAIFSQVKNVELVFSYI
jgi:hypothetical protein